MAMTEAAPGQRLPDDREVLDWERFGHATRALAEAVVESGFEPDIVVAVARGGLLPGGALSYALGTKAVGTLNVEFYTGIDTRLPGPVVLPPLLDTDAFHGLRALIVDDVADTGEPGPRPPAHGIALRRGADRRALREAALRRHAGLRVATHRPVDHLPVVGAAGGRPTRASSG